MLGKQTHSTLDILVVGKINFLRKEKTLLHTNTKISNTLHLLSLLIVTYSKLRHPDTVDKPLTVLHNIVENQVQKHKKLHPHQLVMLTVSEEHLHLRNVSVENEYTLLCIHRRTKNKHLLPTIYTEKTTIVEITRLYRILQFRLKLKHR